jgi:hypothetical protein
VRSAKNDRIGNRKTDFRTLVIASKLFVPVDVHANLGYTIAGSPPKGPTQESLGNRRAA